MPCKAQLQIFSSRFLYKIISIASVVSWMSDCGCIMMTIMASGFVVAFLLLLAKRMAPMLSCLMARKYTSRLAICARSYIVFAHIVEDRTLQLPADLADYEGNQHRTGDLPGNDLGDLVAEYQLEYADGSRASVPIYRRFAIQQAHIGWGASAFAAVTHQQDTVVSSVSESLSLGKMPAAGYGWGETRHGSGRDAHAEHIWLYALPNPEPGKTIAALRCLPKNERALIYGISTTQLVEHPLRGWTRRKLALTLPEAVEFNARGELEAVDIDLGQVISARAKLEYDRDAWFGVASNVQPQVSERVAIIEYAAHPQGKLYLRDSRGELHSYPLGELGAAAVIEVAEARQLVQIKVMDQQGRPVAARVHFHGSAGEYLPPRGNHRRVNPFWFEDNYGEFVNSRNQYAYIQGHCELEAPLGEVFVEISRGYEVKPIRSSFEVTAETSEITFELENVLDWRERGWVTADTHVHFLSPQTALLEGAAEGVNVVNLLASQWGEMYSNVSDFDGRSTLGAKDFWRRWRISGAGWHGESDAGAGAYFLAGVFGGDDSSLVQRGDHRNRLWAMRWRLAWLIGRGVASSRMVWWFCHMRRIPNRNALLILFWA